MNWHIVSAHAYMSGPFPDSGRAQEEVKARFPGEYNTFIGVAEGTIRYCQTGMETDLYIVSDSALAHGGWPSPVEPEC